MNLRQLAFPKEQFFPVAQTKKQIVLHHTASGRGIDGDYKHWLDTPARIATCIIIDRDGVGNQLFSSAFWGHHLGTSLPNNTVLNRESIGVELDAWGPLLKKGDKFYSYTGSEVPSNEVTYHVTGFGTMPLSGFFSKEKVVNQPAYYYHSYTPEQIQLVVELCKLWKERYGISLRYNEDMWRVSDRACKGVQGVWAHCSFRRDKFDVHPQPELVAALKSLSEVK